MAVGEHVGLGYRGREVDLAHGETLLLLFGVIPVPVVSGRLTLRHPVAETGHGMVGTPPPVNRPSDLKLTVAETKTL